MARWALFFGLALILLGIWAYLGGNQTSSALMPAAFGIALGVLGATARTGKEKARMVSMHIAAAVAVIGFLVYVSSIFQYVQMQRGQITGDQRIVQEHALAAVILLFFVLLSVLSFIGARKARQATPSPR